MIVKVPEGRRDRKSSFHDLAKYVSEGLDEDKEKVFSGAPGFDDIAAYVIADGANGQRVSDQEKTIAIEVGYVTSLRTASQEMTETAARATRVDEPIFHYILSWQEHERPNNEDVFKAAKYTLKALGLEGHQYIAAIHGNTDNLHCHVVVNRVDPLTFKPKHLEWSFKTLHRAARELEIEQGWAHDDGLFVVQLDSKGNKYVVESSKQRSLETLLPGAPVSQKASSFEVWSGQMSLERWVKEIVSEKIIPVLDDPNSNWDHLHQVLADVGLKIEPTSNAGYRLTAHDKTGETIGSVAASKALRGLSGQNLQLKLGPFVAASPTMEARPTRTYKRDPLARLDKRLQRQAVRDELYKKYQAETAQIKRELSVKFRPAESKIEADYKQKSKELFQRQKNLREKLKADPGISNKQAHYSIIRMMVVQQRFELAENKKKALINLRASKPKVPSWREYVETKAQSGDEAAISALQGLIYQEKRNAKKKSVPLPSEDKQPSVHAPLGHQFDDPRPSPLRNFIWKVSGNGNVIYSHKSGERIFTDSGNKLNFDKATVSDAELDVVLRYAKDKWNGKLKLAGGDENFKKRLVDKANKLGIKIQEAPSRGNTR